MLQTEQADPFVQLSSLFEHSPDNEDWPDNLALLFCPQRLHGIEPGGPARRHDSRSQRDCCEKQWHHSERQWIVWRDAKQETLQQAGGRNR